VGPSQADQVGDVLARPKISRKYHIAPADRLAFLDLLRSEAILLPHAPRPRVCRDPDDDRLLGCAAAGGADYRVTGDDDLLTLRQYRDVAIVDARTFLAVLSAELG
jgi:putative PIN family toxin of toxin-antitoxin system